MTYDECVGYSIRMFRKEKGETLKTLAAKVGLTGSALSRIETGKTQSNVVHLRKLSRALGIEASMIVLRAENLIDV